MAVVEADGRNAVTHLYTEESFGDDARPFASLLACQLETGRTHQIRVHAAHIGHALVGDPIYGRPRQISSGRTDQELRRNMQEFPRQALHAASLGFKHPISGKIQHFQTDLPPDMNHLLSNLRRNA